MEGREGESVGEQEGLGVVGEGGKAHGANWGYCREFVADFATIVSAANELPAEVEPPARLWISLRAQLELEGIIKTPVVSAHRERSPCCPRFHDLFPTPPFPPPPAHFPTSPPACLH